MFKHVLAAYGLNETNCTIRAFGTGLINHTWKIEAGDTDYILQQINQDVFRRPDWIAANTEAIAEYLNQHSPDYLFIRPLPTLDGRNLVHDQAKGYFRLCPFVPGSHTCDVVQSTHLAFEAARQFGKFTRLLAGFPATSLHITLPDFHNLELRYRQFEVALAEGNPDRIRQSSEYIGAIRSYSHIVDQYSRIANNAGFTLRVTHHDTKISNVLLDDQDHGLCVIDLDTVMPGWFISDLGDMMRTYLSPVSEEEKDFSLISIRDEYFQAIVKGYIGEMKEELSAVELDHILYAGKFMIYMQALRFLTDHINNDLYYGAAYPDHNFVRAGNQITLLERLTEREPRLNELVKNLNLTHAPNQPD